MLKILLISDTHANIEALKEVVNHTDFDETVFMSDAVDYSCFEEQSSISSGLSQGFVIS
jgi:predicted phosphodiesterase